VGAQLTREQRQSVVRLRGHGLGWKEVARAAGCTLNAAWRTGERPQKGPGQPAAWTPRPGRLTIEDREEIVVGLATGETFVAIALRIGKSPSCVSREVGPTGAVRTTGPGAAI
jgi:IS30 family transposase